MVQVVLPNDANPLGLHPGRHGHAPDRHRRRHRLPPAHAQPARHGRRRRPAVPASDQGRRPDHPARAGHRRRSRRRSKSKSKCFSEGILTGERQLTSLRLPDVRRHRPRRRARAGPAARCSRPTTKRRKAREAEAAGAPRGSKRARNCCRDPESRHSSPAVARAAPRGPRPFRGSAAPVRASAAMFSRRLTPLMLRQISRAVSTASSSDERRVAMEVRRGSRKTVSRSAQEARDVPRLDVRFVGVDVDREVEEIRHEHPRRPARRPSPVCSTFSPSTMTMSGRSTTWNSPGDDVVRLVRVHRRVHGAGRGLDVRHELDQPTDVVAFRKPFALQQPARLEHAIRQEEAVGRHEVDARMRRPARRAALAGCARTCSCRRRRCRRCR